MTTTVLDTKTAEAEDEISDYDKYIITPAFNRFPGTIFDTKLK